MGQENIYQIYDKVMKKILTLSSIAVLNFINAIFETNYPLDSAITYNWTENYDDELKKTIADCILTINGRASYHFEAQISEDEEMQFRVFDYGYHHALKTRNGTEVLTFPEPIIIYLYKHGKTPDVQSLMLDFGSQGSFEYKVNTFKLLEHSLEDLKKRKMIILLPFFILKFREEIEQARTKENMEALKDLILNDIIGTIDENVELGNLTLADASRLRNLIGQLYRHVYAHFREMEEEGINDMVDEGLVLEMDIIEYNHKKELEKNTQEVTAQLVKNAYESVGDVKKVAEMLKIPVDEVENLIKK